MCQEKVGGLELSPAPRWAQSLGTLGCLRASDLTLLLFRHLLALCSQNMGLLGTGQAGCCHPLGYHPPSGFGHHVEELPKARQAPLGARGHLPLGMFMLHKKFFLENFQLLFGVLCQPRKAGWVPSVSIPAALGLWVAQSSSCPVFLLIS